MSITSHGPEPCASANSAISAYRFCQATSDIIKQFKNACQYLILTLLFILYFFIMIIPLLAVAFLRRTFLPSEYIN